MNIKTKRNFYLLLIGVFVVIIIVSIYYLLGGFTDIKVYRMEPVSRTVAGIFFEDPGSDEAFDHRKACRELLEKKDIDGILTEVIYLNDSTADEEKGRFVGISLEQDIAEIPRHFEVREYNSGVRYAVFLAMHFLVQPRPPKIEAMLRERASEDGFELENFFFSLVYSDGSRSVEAWVKN